MSELITNIESLINQGRYVEARVKAEGALKHSDEVRLKQLYALALSKAGVPEMALEYLEPLYRQFPDDVECAGILGSINKELFKKNQSTQYAIRSRDTYLKNFNATKNYYTGINAASMSAMAGQAGKGREIATEVIGLLEGKEHDFWSLATLGEAYMLTKNRSKANELYVQARKVAGYDWGKITSVYNQLWLLNHFIPVSSEIMKLFSPPTVVAFAGHMIDKPDRPLPRFPASIEASIKQAIIHSLHTLQARIGYCSLACGGDILFAEAMAEAGGEVNLFLPFGIEDFLNTSINFAGTQWADRFHALLNKYPVSFITTDHYLGYDDLFSYQSKIIFGSAVLRSTSQHNEPTLLTVLSEVDLKRQEGGTRDTLRLWPFPQHHVNINPDIFISQQASAVTVSTPTPMATAAESETKNVSFIRPVLYIVYCELIDTLPVEREKVIKVIHSTIEEPGESLKYFNLDKDGILIMFDAQASAEALVRVIHDNLVSLNAHSVCKISLHAGPVYLEEESNQLYSKAYGASVDLVKKLSAIALPGTVCASTNFAALLALNEASYTLEYSGILHTDDTSNSFPVYKVGFKMKY